MTASAATQLSLRQEAVKARLVAELGEWGPAWEAILELDEELLDAYLSLRKVASGDDRLDAKTRALIGIALDAAVTTLDAGGVRTHIRAALRAGASAGEIAEVIDLTSTLGIHAAHVGMPIVADVLAARGPREPNAAGREHRARLKAEFVERRGYWHDFWDDALELDPELFEAYIAFSSLPGKDKLLEPKVRELIALALNASTTHLYAPGIRLHAEGALNQGARVGELLGALELASAIGVHSAAIAMPVLAEELARGDAAGGR